MPTGQPYGPVTLEQVAQEIQRVALIVEKDPSKVTYPDMIRYGEIPERRILQAGGLPKAKATFIKSLEPMNDAEIRTADEMRGQIRKMRRDKGDMGAIMLRIEKAVEDMPVLKPSKYQAKKVPEKFKRTLQLILSDTHFGLDLDPRETIHKYGAVEEARALAYIAKNVSEYKLEHRDETELVINMLGDMIENHLHAGGASEALHIQVCRAIHLLTQFLYVMANNFRKVKVNFSVGNHGRDKSIHPQRATATKYNAVETSIYFAIRTALGKVQNVEFNQPMTPWVDYSAFGHRFYACHGDTNFNVGGVGRQINVGNLEAMTDKINAPLPNSKKYSVFMVGHLHQFTNLQLPNGVWLIVNGALCPPNPFAQTLNIRTAPQNQALFETTALYPVGDIRAIDAGGSEKDASLDQIIQPWAGL